EKSIRDIASEGTRLLITVDCGINSIPEIVLAKKLGMEVIVTDHHQVPSDFEPICPTINPLRSDSSFYFRGLSGVGVAFYLAIGVRSYLRDEVYFSRETDEPDLKPYLDLVALGTVADVVPLIEENRILVKSGLRVLADSRRHGIRALFNISGINMGQTITSDDIAFKLAPRLNAIGRLDSATGAVKLLTTNNIEEASLIADHMESLNAQRQAIQDKILSSGKKMIEGIRDFQKQRTIVLFDPEWHLGVVGIVASKIAEEYYRPTFILGVKGGLIRGSGRSIDGFNLWEALSNLGDILEHFGGHYHAAGISFEHKNLEAFCERLEEFAEKGIDSGDMIPKIDIDALLNLDSINLKSLKEIEMLHPFGCQNPQPIFSSGPLQVISSRVVGNGHLKIKIKEKGIIFDCIAFRKAGLHPLDGKTVDAVFHLETNEWQGIESIQLVIVDIHVYPSP
ncbi:MAG TPA: single-stranded-DNA-specific exonuclease RecJ, partial [Desulfatiglandales bacterium]|nr:single-stranded-DNA-specific exonuclease RecJ [Desulfatiglandales bacterium]